MSENMLKNSTSKKAKTVTWEAWLAEQNKKTEEIIVSTILVNCSGNISFELHVKDIDH